MSNFAFVLASIAMTVLSWGLYGPLIGTGRHGMLGDHWRPFICVGIAYFLVAVVVPFALLATRGEKGRWTMQGSVWSVLAGGLGAVGALGVILALRDHSNAVFVMPLVFGGAPVVNTFTTMWMTRAFRPSPIFFAGLILVIAGAATVLFCRPQPVRAAEPAAAVESADAPAASETAAHPTVSDPAVGLLAWMGSVIEVLLFAALTIVCWGTYGPILHKGQMLMDGSRMRPFACVGIAYFLVAVLVPWMILATTSDHGEFTPSGTFWSLAGGTAGALGALGIILAFNFGGKPIYVMPLVFGGAPVVNTFTTILTTRNLAAVHPMFYAGLIIVVAGAVTVLVFAPKGGPAGKPH